MENKEHDFKKPIEETSVKLAEHVLSSLLENFSTFIYEDREMTEGEKKDLTEKGTDYSIKLIAAMTESNIPADYASYCIDKIMAALQSIKRYVDGTVRQMHDEVLARTFGAKSPVTNTYATDVATLAEVMDAVKRLRESTGNNLSDYFVENK